MIESADMTEKSVREAGITAPLMIMRSDGGVMDIEAMRKRPILTMLSGPAAGVAAAMMFLRISNGVFLEVGGTSTDISAITNGRAQVRSGEIGGHKVYMRTLDVRTVGVAGGSLPRMRHGKLLAVGPRSAHIAGLNYASFSDGLVDAKIKTIRPCLHDPDDYAVLTSGDGKTTVCLTPTCASNFLQLVPDGDCASGNIDAIRAGFAQWAQALGQSDEHIAEEILRLAAAKCVPVVRALIKDHKLDAETVALVGGGGGAAAIVPFVAKQLGMPYRLAEHADVISAIGVALALIRETVERQVMDPGNEDILKIRQEAHAAVERMGAAPSTIEVHVEVDARTNTIRATAYGATSTTQTREIRHELTDDECLSLVSESLKMPPAQVKLACRTPYFNVFCARRLESRVLGLIKNRLNSMRVVDSSGIIRLQFKNAAALLGANYSVDSTILQVVEEHAQWGDAGKVIPDVILLAGPRIIDLSGLLSTDQVIALARTELQALPKDAPVVVIARLE